MGRHAKSRSAIWGNGISDEFFRERIFQPFSQGRAPLNTRQQRRDRCLGLNILAHLVEGAIGRREIGFMISVPGRGKPVFVSPVPPTDEDPDVALCCRKVRGLKAPVGKSTWPLVFNSAFSLRVVFAPAFDPN